MVIQILATMEKIFYQVVLLGKETTIGVRKLDLFVPVRFEGRRKDAIERHPWADQGDRVFG
jgi:hypothetical protein